MALSIASTALPSLSPRELPQKSWNVIGLQTCRKLRTDKHRVAAGKAASSVCEPLPPDRPVWFPGTSPPQWLDGRGFWIRPFGLGSDAETLKWNAQAELIHGRWAMLAVAGILFPELLESLGFIDKFSWYEAGSQQYLLQEMFSL
ncbi:hypothetical protein C5167_008030 [Papaver somniferum]|uniref:Chlorophyll a-b binding protein, chloroplastic n=1 Tax=Papaver somniferum TaxID=3469 RepID=A0A4Y7JX97_PAPSO|nr:hypothetical protein C5167_008030 [Papaver somniferum]